MWKKPIIALSGGLGSGKSTVADLFRAKGVPVIDADILAREVVAPNTPGLAEIKKAFGANILLPDGSLDRRTLARQIFSDEHKRKQLESLLHPRIRAAFRDALNSLPDSPAPFALYAIPLFFEAQSGHDELKKVIVVWAPEETCISRIMSRDQLSRDEALQRVRTQLPIDRKAAQANWVIKNVGDRSELNTQVENIFSEAAKL